jgi:hypothetical protein
MTFTPYIVSRSVDATTETTTTSNTNEIIPEMSLTIVNPGVHTVTFDSQCTLLSGNTTAHVADALASTYTTLKTMTATSASSAAVIYGVVGGNQTLYAGIYATSAAMSVTGGLTLDGQLDPDAVFVLRCVGAFDTGAGTTVTLSNGTKASNVFWVADAAVGIAANCTLPGTIISRTGAFAVGTNCVIDGRVLSFTGAITLTAGNVITVPVDATSLSSLDLGAMEQFVVFSHSSTVSSSGVSTFDGHIGSNGGAVTGFGSSVVTNGTVYEPGLDNNALAVFTLYLNGAPIPRSIRARLLSQGTGEISLYVALDVVVADVISVWCRIDSGTIYLENGLFCARLQ